MANRKRKELRKLTWLLCTFPDSAEYPFLHGGRRDSWLPRENIRERDPARAWETSHQQVSWWLQQSPEKRVTGQRQAQRPAHVTLKGLTCQRTKVFCWFTSKYIYSLFHRNLGWDNPLQGRTIPCSGSPNPHHDQKWKNASLMGPYVSPNLVSLLPPNSQT